MKRIVILIDGTWNDENNAAEDTNVAKLSWDDIPKEQFLIKPQASDGVEQLVKYHAGVGAGNDFAKKYLGGAIGLGLKKIVNDAYETLVENYESGDEIYLFGFSRGAYAVRALAGMIGASGIRRKHSAVNFDMLWDHARVKPEIRAAAESSGAAPASASASDKSSLQNFAAAKEKGDLHSSRAIKCVGVWDTVGSYGVPAGFGLAPLARIFTALTLGFRDTSFGKHIDVGLHAIAIDEQRREFVPTLWTAPKGEHRENHVEQTWFAGVHCNIGGGYPDRGLSDLSLLWMIARVEALTGLQFNHNNLRAALKPSVHGEIYDSSAGYFVSKLIPAHRVMLSSDALDYGIVFNTVNPKKENINERVHWSVLKKSGSACVINGGSSIYKPVNLPPQIPPDRIAEITPEEKALLDSMVLEREVRSS
jgi:uncharacterized protein (DUF2235 family)